MLAQRKYRSILLLQMHFPKARKLPSRRDKDLWPLEKRPHGAELTPPPGQPSAVPESPGYLIELHGGPGVFH